MLGNCDNKINMITTTNQWPHPHPHPQVSSLSLSLSQLLLLLRKTTPCFCFIAFVQEYPYCVVNFYPKSTPSPILSFSLLAQNQIIVDDRMPMASSSAAAAANKVAVMADKPNSAADPHPLKCPRCDSSNTKFCYYNNYSLSQPRHFCKACKRYWTRGGTLRNVPVGGGCRKNKRPKRHSQPHTDLPQQQPPPPPPPPSTHIQNPLFYGLNSNPLELNFPFSTFRDESAFDLHPQINALGLGFSSELASSSPFSSPANNNSIFFGSSSSASTMASVLASTHKFGAPANYEDPGVKAEGESRMPWNPNPNLNPNPIDQINSSDPSSLVWNTSTIGAWFDSSSMGSSVPSLI